MSVAIFGKFGFFSNAKVKIELSPYALILELSVVFIMVGGLGSVSCLKLQNCAVFLFFILSFGFGVVPVLVWGRGWGSFK